MNCATLLFPHPAGPVINQIWWCLVSGWLFFVLVPLAIVPEEEGAVGIGRISDAEVGCPIVGRLSYDNIIVVSLLILWKFLLQSVW